MEPSPHSRGLGEDAGETRAGVALSFALSSTGPLSGREASQTPETIAAQAIMETEKSHPLLSASWRPR